MKNVINTLKINQSVVIEDNINAVVIMTTGLGKCFNHEEIGKNLVKVTRIEYVKHSNSKQELFELLDLWYGENIEVTNEKIPYIRVIVSQYNKQNGDCFRVNAKDEKIVISKSLDDIWNKETITRTEHDLIVSKTIKELNDLKLKIKDFNMVEDSRTKVGIVESSYLISKEPFIGNKIPGKELFDVGKTYPHVDNHAADAKIYSAHEPHAGMVKLSEELIDVSKIHGHVEYNEKGEKIVIRKPKNLELTPENPVRSIQQYEITGNPIDDMDRIETIQEDFNWPPEHEEFDDNMEFMDDEI